mmetsp:Transcript_24902/g.37844  ORF Transcript_24902/g.37844 Transcript_24902/m.37844 type:complete len:201 (+) Transcript_24902:154-756(+)|eukprot:CAMPEP_0178922992 /NCGR_PEP_ID=MMETSP0786-20121207/16470_1 /TAXON_ID=186022 /ORGANISM="Thalassionema frauenfeldii, Strain CCMP 1798" /LENGTH=200 /DNA_ID=CAMNT_0020597435 /DNA_START=92 /DNA_END=694 /DNA_ORIENTATION=-
MISSLIQNDIKSSINTEGTESNSRNVNTPISKYLQELQDYQRDSMSTLYTHTVDRPCLGGCENDEIDLFLSCRQLQPLSFLPFVKHDETREDVDSWVDPLPVAGAYTIPTECEYCGAKHVSECDPELCQRPRLFFQKKRPPFCQNDKKWDPVTDFAIPEPEKKKDEDLPSSLPQNEEGTPMGWVNGIFGRTPKSPKRNNK